MSTHGTIRRYSLIIEKISYKQFPSFQNIKDFLFDHGFEVSKRTVQRDIEQIRFEYGFEILYDRPRNGYYIDKESSLDPDAFLRFLEIVNTANLLIESLKESKDALSYISFESHGQLRGIEHLKNILFAIKNHRTVSFTHVNFRSDIEKDHSMKPYLLKEYQNRWYLIGLVDDLQEFRTYAIDRITDLKVNEKTFKTDPNQDPSELFENTIGLTYNLNEIKDVVLSFTPTQGKYIKTLPLHKSQEVLIDNDEEFRIKLRIIPNLEFKQKILMHGRTVRVLEPVELVDEIKKSLEETLSNYNK